MDIFSHGLWTGAVYKIINTKKDKKLNVLLSVFWGIFSDIFSFTLVFIWLLINVIFGNIKFNKPSEIEPGIKNDLTIFHLTSALYNISHSLIIFIIVFILVYLTFKRPIWELGGWGLHIIIDIPTHSYEFYPTPFLWPISDWKFNGFSWVKFEFLIINYLAIFIVYYLLYKYKSKSNN